MTRSTTKLWQKIARACTAGRAVAEAVKEGRHWRLREAISVHARRSKACLANLASQDKIRTQNWTRLAAPNGITGD